MAERAAPQDEPILERPEAPLAVPDPGEIRLVSRPPIRHELPPAADADQSLDEMEQRVRLVAEMPVNQERTLEVPGFGKMRVAPGPDWKWADEPAGGQNVPEPAKQVDNTVAIHANLANSLIDAITSLGKVVARMGERMATVESLVARSSVPLAAAPAAEPKDETLTHDELREAMWKRADMRLKGVEPESFLPDTSPLPVAKKDKKCKTCRQNDRYGPSDYCLPCLQEQNANRCDRGHILYEGDNACRTCAEEARVLERVKPGVRHPVGEFSHEVIEMIQEGFPG